MKQLFFLAWAGLKSRRRSTALLVTTIALAVIFLVVMGLIGSSSLYTVDVQNKELYGEQKVVAWDLAPQTEAEIRARPVWSRIGKMAVHGVVETEADLLLGVGTVDETGRELGHLRLSEGRWPQTREEIVLEKSAYKYLGGRELAVGDRITLKIAPASAGEIQSRTYTVAGLMENYTAVWRNTYSRYDIEEETLDELLPVSCLVSEEEGAALSAKSKAILLLNSRSNSYDLLRGGLVSGIASSFNYTTYPSIGIFGGLGEQTLGVIGISALIGGMILICMMVILLNGFLMAVDRRKRQLSLLRSIGATRRQARRYILCEALLLLGIGVPVGLILGVPLSLGAVRLFALLNQSELFYHFNGWVLLLATAVCLLCVCLAVLIPAWRASRCAPVAGIRPVYFGGRKAAHRKRKGAALHPFTLMLHSLRKSKGKTLLTVVTFSLVILVFNVMMLFDLVAYKVSYEIPNATIGWSGSYTLPVTGRPEKILLPDTIFDDMRRSGAVDRQVARVTPLFYCSLPFSRYDAYLNGHFRFDNEMLGVTKWERYNYHQFNEQVEWGYSDQEFLAKPDISIFDDQLLRDCAPFVMDGRVDAEAVNRGEEILLCMPDYALKVTVHENGSASSLRVLRDGEQAADGWTVYTNKNWKAGDTLPLTWVEELEAGVFQIHSKPVKIGAILRDTPPVDNSARGIFGMVVGEKTLRNLDLPYLNSSHALYFDPDADIPETEARIREIAEKICPQASVFTKTEEATAEQRIRRTTLTVSSMLTVCLLALGFLGLMNTVSNRIYNRMHEIGLLRCIGMTRGQICRMLVYEGAAFGVLASLIGVTACVLLFPRLVEGWTATAMPYYLAGSALVCIALAALTIFIPAWQALRYNPTETIRMNV